MRALLLLLLLAGCTATLEVTTTAPAPTPSSGLTSTPVTASVDGAGLVSVDLPIGADVDAFSIEGGDSDLQLLALYAPDGSLAVDCGDWQPSSPYSLTDACYIWQPLTFAFPPGPAWDVTPGTWRADLQVADPAPGSTLALTLWQRRSITASSVVVPALLLLDTHLPKRFRDPAVLSQSIEHWRSIWAAQGLALQPRWGTVDAPRRNTRDRWWHEIVDGQAGQGELVVVFTDLRSADDDGTLGFVTAVPGPVGASIDGIAIMDVLEHAGADGQLSTPEGLTLGETVAHEALHYLGLNHPVEQDLATWDALADTLDCTEQDACDEALGDNVMYPVTLCEDGTCVNQVALTPEQRFVAQRWVGAR